MFLFRRRARRRGIGLLIRLIVMIVVFIAVLASRSRGQEPASYDDVNAVAARMYCPECEMVPLDRCFTEVCIQWKQDIAEQLDAGRTSDQIVNDFVARFGDQVVGVPQDSTLRTLTLAAPWLLAAGIAAVGLYTLYRLRGSPRAVSTPDAPSGLLDRYRARLENDLKQ